MRPKECAKYVFNDRHSPNNWCLNKPPFIRLRDFSPIVSDTLVAGTGFKLYFYHFGNPALAWKDKHGNIVVRVHHDNKQTKINF